MDLINGPSRYTALRRRLADPGLFLDSGFRRNDGREGSGEFRGIGGVTWHACRLGDVLTLKRSHDLPDSRRQDGDVPVVSSPLKKKGFYLTDAGADAAHRNPTVPQPIPGQDRDEAGAKFLMRRVLLFASGLAAA